MPGALELRPARPGLGWAQLHSRVSELADAVNARRGCALTQWVDWYADEIGDGPYLALMAARARAVDALQREGRGVEVSLVRSLVKQLLPQFTPSMDPYTAALLAGLAAEHISDADHDALTFHLRGLMSHALLQHPG